MSDHYKIPLDVPLGQQLIAEQFPEWADLEITPLEFSGWDCALLHMDRIIAFDQGVIVEDGTHAELLSLNGLYRNLWDAQVSGFLGDDQMEDEA
jgi:hypothetical protein